jgi:predicted aspartyl protease
MGRLDEWDKADGACFCCERKPMGPTASARRVRSGLLRLFALLLVLAACATLGRNTVLFRPNVDGRLPTQIKAGLFLTTVRIGDREASPFLIDTGSSFIVLDSELAKSLHLSLREEGKILESTQTVQRGTLASLEVGPLAFRDTDVIILDLSAATPVLWERLAGSLGAPFFARVVVAVDYPRGSITCFDPKSYRLPRGQWLPIALHAGRPTIAARLEGNITGQFLLDTGSNFTVLFYPEFIQRHGLLDHRETSPHTTVRVDGPHETRRARIGWFELAGRRFERPLVTFAPAEMTKASPKDLAGEVGGGILREFTIVFNYPESKIALLPK